MKYNKIIVTGGSGMVGRSLQQIMPNATYLSSRDYDLTKESEVSRMYSELSPDCVISLSARVGGITDNINKPAEYFADNVMMNTLLTHYAYLNNVERYISILSTCIYPDKTNVYPLHEFDLHNGPPTTTNFSYGYAKRCQAVQIDAYNKQYGTKYQYLIPCNLYGPFDKFGENSHFIAALIKKIHQAKISGSDKIVLFGTGTPLRQFMHSDDLASVIKYCLENDVYYNMNVATDEILSINEMAEIALEACDASHLKIEYDSTKPDGQFRKDVSSTILKRFVPDFSPIALTDGIEQTYKFVVENNLI